MRMPVGVKGDFYSEKIVLLVSFVNGGFHCIAQQLSDSSKCKKHSPIKNCQETDKKSVQLRQYDMRRVTVVNLITAFSCIIDHHFV